MVHASTPSTQDTTALVPDISAPDLATLVQRMIAGEPEAAERIQCGVAVLLSGALHDTATLGVYRADGCEGVYETTSACCTCPDATHRSVTCKHQHAVRLLSAASAVAHRLALETRYTLTAKGVAASRA